MPPELATLCVAGVSAAFSAGSYAVSEKARLAYERMRHTGENLKRAFTGEEPEQDPDADLLDKLEDLR